MTSQTNGTNGTPIPVVSAVELQTQLARHRTALVALLALVRREGGYLPAGDQLLLTEIQRLLDENPR